MHDHSGKFSTPLSVLMEQADKKNKNNRRFEYYQLDLISSYTIFSLRVVEIYSFQVHWNIYQDRL